MQPLITFPDSIAQAISSLLAEDTSQSWLSNSLQLHTRYISRDTGKNKRYVQTFTDVLSYLGLRSPATYAQTYGAMTFLKEMIPSWTPSSFLDLGSGPGVSMWAAKTVWPDLAAATCIDQERNFLSMGERIAQITDLSLQVEWKDGNVLQLERLLSRRFDLVLISNILNELSPAQVDTLIGQAWNACSGVLLIVEAGTPFASGIVSSVAKKLSKVGNLLAPYVNNQFVTDNTYYLHFPQRFIRPEFERRVRQRMRDDSQMASDWEEAKYSFVAIGNMQPEKDISARCVGPVKIQKGFLEVPILLKDRIAMLKVLKRDKDKYARFKKLAWGELISEDIF